MAPRLWNQLQEDIRTLQKMLDSKYNSNHSYSKESLQDGTKKCPCPYSNLEHFVGKVLHETVYDYTSYLLLQ